MDYTKVSYYSGLNTFKNTGVFTTSVDISGTIGAFSDATFSRTITLTENQVFSYAIAQYPEFAKYSAGLTTPAWQRIPTYRAYVVSSPAANLAANIYITLNGLDVTFTVFIDNPNGAPETLTTANIPIRYVTFTLAN